MLFTDLVSPAVFGIVWGSFQALGLLQLLLSWWEPLHSPSLGQAQAFTECCKPSLSLRLKRNDFSGEFPEISATADLGSVSGAARLLARRGEACNKMPFTFSGERFSLQASAQGESPEE